MNTIFLLHECCDVRPSDVTLVNTFFFLITVSSFDETVEVCV